MSAEPRKDAALAYATAFRSRLDRLRDAIVEVAMVAHVSEQEVSTLLARARELWDEPVGDLDRAEKAVTGVLPEAVAISAVEASRRLRDYHATVRLAIDSGAEEREARVDSAKKAHATTYDAYLDFLHSTAEALGDYDLLRDRA
ncbi:hypothetical protein [Streptomyces sp. NPDC003943]